MSFKVWIPKLRTDEKLFLFMLFLIINPISYARIHPLVIMASVIAWGVVAYGTASKMFSGCAVSSTFAMVSVYPILMCLYSFRSDVFFEKKSVIDCIIMLTMMFYLKRKDSVNKSSQFILLYLTVIAVYSIAALANDPMVSRRMASNGVEYGNFLTGGYNTVYGLLYLSIAVLGISVYQKKYMILYGLFAVFILMSQYVTASILLAIGSVFVVLKNNSMLRNVFLICVCACLLLVLYYPQGIVDGLFAVSDWFPQNTFQNSRMRQLGEVVSGTISQGVIASKTAAGSIHRIDLYRITLDTIRENPMWGAGNMSIQSIGGHATFLDMIAKYGVICGGVYFFTKIFCLFKIIRAIPAQYRYYYRIVGILYISLGFLNAINDMMISMIVFLAIPYLFIIEDGGHF